MNLQKREHIIVYIATIFVAALSEGVGMVFQDGFWFVFLPLVFALLGGYVIIKTCLK